MPLPTLSCASRSRNSAEVRRGISGGDGQKPGILTGDTHSHRVVAGLAVDRRHEIAVDLADKHHADDLERLRIGDAQAVLELRLFADAPEHRVDLRPAAMDEHAADPDAPEQKHVLREREIGFAIDGRAAEFHDDRLARELPDVGQRLDEHLRGLGGAHDVLQFSLM
jgi:hypothetical protein